MAVKRITFLQELLGFMGLEDRLHLAWVSSAEAQRFARIVTEFTEKMRAMGPSPVGKEFALPKEQLTASACGAA